MTAIRSRCVTSWPCSRPRMETKWAGAARRKYRSCIPMDSQVQINWVAPRGHTEQSSKVENSNRYSISIQLDPDEGEDISALHLPLIRWIFSPKNLLQPFSSLHFFYFFYFVLVSQISGRSQPTPVSTRSDRGDGGAEPTMEGSGADSESAAAWTSWRPCGLWLTGPVRWQQQRQRRTALMRHSDPLN